MNEAQINIVQFEEHKEFSIRAITRLAEQLQTRSMHVDPVFSAHYAELKANGSPFPAVTLFFDKENDRYLLADGYTRVHAAESLRLRTIPAVIRIGGIQDALIFGIESNLATKTRSVTLADRRRAAEMLIRNGAGVVGMGSWDWADIWIAESVGLVRAVIIKTRISLERSEGIPIPERVRMRDGRVRVYRSGGQRKREVRTMADGRHRLMLDGRQQELDKNQAIAEQQAREILEERARVDAALMVNSRFVSFLHSRGVSVKQMTMGETRLGGLFCGDSAIAAMRGKTAEDYLSAAMRALITQKSLPGLRRSIVVGRSECAMVGVAILESRRCGVEFMTPENFVAEFGPEPKSESA